MYLFSDATKGNGRRRRKPRAKAVSEQTSQQEQVASTEGMQPDGLSPISPDIAAAPIATSGGVVMVETENVKHEQFRVTDEIKVRI